MLNPTRPKEERQTLFQIARLIEEFRKLDPEMPIQQAMILLIVTRQEGITVKEIGQLTGQATSSTSRNVQALSKVHRKTLPGLDLVYSQEDPMDRRQKQVYLTAKGKTVMKHMIEIFQQQKKETIEDEH